MHPRFPADEEPSRANPQELTAAYWQKLGKDAVKDHYARLLNTKKAKNIIFFLGDGMSIPTIAAARMYMGQLAGQTGEEAQLSFDKFPVSGLSKVTFQFIFQSKIILE